jgi:hypothetical protein
MGIQNGNGNANFSAFGQSELVTDPGAATESDGFLPLSARTVVSDLRHSGRARSSQRNNGG